MTNKNLVKDIYTISEYHLSGPAEVVIAKLIEIVGDKQNAHFSFEVDCTRDHSAGNGCYDYGNLEVDFKLTYEREATSAELEAKRIATEKLAASKERAEAKTKAAQLKLKEKQQAAVEKQLRQLVKKNPPIHSITS